MADDRSDKSEHTEDDEEPHDVVGVVALAARVDAERSDTEAGSHPRDGTPHLTALNEACPGVQQRATE